MIISRVFLAPRPPFAHFSKEKEKAGMLSLSTSPPGFLSHYIVPGMCTLIGNLVRSLLVPAHAGAGKHCIYHQMVSNWQTFWLKDLNVFFLCCILAEPLNYSVFRPPIIIISAYSKISRSGHFRIRRNIGCRIVLVLLVPPQPMKYNFIHPVTPFCNWDQRPRIYIWDSTVSGTQPKLCTEFMLRNTHVLCTFFVGFRNGMEFVIHLIG
jgi:hypothetical protein